MKHAMFSVLTVVIVLLALMIPGGAIADTTVVTGQVAETPTITSISPNDGDIDTAPTVTILGTNFIEGHTEINVSGTGVTAGAVTFTSSGNISATFTVDPAAAAGARSVTVTVGGKTSSAVNFTVNSSFTVTAPSPVTLGVMIAGNTTSGNSTTAGSVVTNATAWQIVAADEKATNAGYMVNGSQTPLENKFQISPDNVTFADADSGITYDDSASTLPFYCQQEIDASDAGGTYTITITFTGSVL